LLAALRSTQKPVGIFAANGALAVEVHETCEGASIPVPDHVAIVGMDDHLQSVGAASRLISGVDPNLEEQGYQGAAMLDRMMRSGRVPARPMRIAPRGVMARRSSDLLAVGHPGVARALRVIGERLGEGIGVEDLARAAGMSVRGLHEAFRESLGCSPGERLRRVRLEEAKRLLRGTGEKLQSIAEQTGFANLNTFFVAFKKAEGMTPAEYRRTSSRGR
jgi:LacI family transcriptional regulator